MKDLPFCGERLETYAIMKLFFVKRSATVASDQSSPFITVGPTRTTMMDGYDSSDASDRRNSLWSIYYQSSFSLFGLEEKLPINDSAIMNL